MKSWNQREPLQDLAAGPGTAAGLAVRRARPAPDCPRSVGRRSARMERILRDQWTLKAVSNPR